MVIWKHSSELIIKAQLGQRREHIIADSRLDHLFYEPEYEKFIGQFSIDYDPEPFPKFTEQERIAFLAEWAAKIHAVKSGHPIQFNLMLNGVKAKATDRSIYSSEALDDINQVKVQLGGQRLSDDINLTTKDRHDRFVKLKVNKTWHVDKQSSDAYGMQCYGKKDASPQSHMWCFGASAYAKVSGASFGMIGNKRVFVNYYEPIYGGINVEYLIDSSQLKHWKEVDAAIWRLLERWNISQLTTPIKIKK